MQSIITTFAGDIYIITDKTPDQVSEAIEPHTMVRMPNGSRIHKSSIASIQDYYDYAFQTEQKAMHKRGHYMRRGEWYDNTGHQLGIKTHLERITGKFVPPALKPGHKPQQFDTPVVEARIETPAPLQLGSEEETHG